MITIDCISDLHGFFPKLPGGDILIVAGDLTGRDEKDEYINFCRYIRHSGYKKIFVISGNHDNLMEKEPKFFPSNDQVLFLCNSGTEFEGLKIWGTPHSLLFSGVNPKCTAFMKTEEELEEIYSHIPNDIDILISHTPPYGILDKSIRGEYCGSISLRNAMMRVKPKVLIFGHIHEQGGKEIDLITTKVINCSYVDEKYKPVNKPMRIYL